MRSILFLRGRALLSTLVLVSAAASLVVLAAPAGAAEDPADRSMIGAPDGVAERGATTLAIILEALDRLRNRAAESAGGTEASTAAEPGGREESCEEAGDSNDVPRVVADIFRCHLTRAGYPDADVRRIAAEAVVISHCESKWDPAIVVFNGRYLEQAHPRTGYRYSAAGVFQFIRATADKWIDGGYGQVTNPRRNIDAAARLYLHNRTQGLGGWDDWACAAANDGFKVGSVLPGWPGGPPSLPQWALKYVA